KDLGDRDATLTANEARVREREAASDKVSRAAAERALEAETALKAMKERERALEKAEKKLQETEGERAERAKAKEETRARELDEARKLLQTREREDAKRIKEVTGLQASLRAANEALERRELELEAEITRAKAAVESEADRSGALEKDLNASRKDLAKRSEERRVGKEESESGWRQGQNQQKEIPRQLANARR